MTYWHDRWFPAATGRLLGPTGTLINCAKAKQHREPNLAGAPRHHFDDTGCPPSRNTRQRMCPRGPPPASRPNRALGPKGRREIHLRQRGRPADRTPSRRRRTGTRERQHAVTGSYGFVPRTSSPGDTGRRSLLFSSRCGSSMDEPQESSDVQQRAFLVGALSPVGSRRGINRSRIPQITL